MKASLSALTELRARDFEAWAELADNATEPNAFMHPDFVSLAAAALRPRGLRILRGFVGDAFAGEAYTLGTAEYRFPLWNVELGAWTLPFYLRRLHAAMYTDVGDAYTPGRRDFHLHAGAGAELRAEVVLGWVLPTDLRFGCARGLENSPLAILDCYAALGGVF